MKFFALFIGLVFSLELSPLEKIHIKERQNDLIEQFDIFTEKGFSKETVQGAKFLYHCEPNFRHRMNNA